MVTICLAPMGDSCLLRIVLVSETFKPSFMKILQIMWKIWRERENTKRKCELDIDPKLMTYSFCTSFQWAKRIVKNPSSMWEILSGHERVTDRQSNGRTGERRVFELFPPASRWGIKAKQYYFTCLVIGQLLSTYCKVLEQ